MKTDTFSQQEIDHIVERAFNGEKVKVMTYRVVRYSKDKVGFLGNHQNLELKIIHGNSSNEPKVHRFFVKGLPPLPEEQIQSVRNMFIQESIYFNEILPLLKKYCPSTEDWSPRCLLASDKLIVLEDMRLHGYTMSNSKMLTADQLCTAFKAQACLHAASLVAEKQLGMSLSEAYPKGCAEMLFTDAELKRNGLEVRTDLAKNVAEKLGRDGRRLSAGFRKGFYQIYNQNKLKTKLPKVFGHGDARLNNYLFSTSEPSKCVLVDFQMSRYGPPTFDLVLLTYLSTTRDFRQREMRKVIETYHEQLCAVLEKNDPEIRKPTLDEILEEYEELRATAFYCTAVYYPFLWADKSTLAKYDEQELFKKILFPEEISSIMQLYDEDREFATRMNEVIEEAVEYFEKHDAAIEP